jgi:hypothetical protein
MTREEFNALAATWPAADYWDCDDTLERLTSTEVLEALEQGLDRIPDADQPSFEAQLRAELPDGITIYGWQRDTIELDNLADRACDALAEQYAEDYGDPDGDEDLPSAVRSKLRTLFGAAVKEALEGQTAWRCTQTEEIDLDIDMLIDIAKLEWPEWFGGSEPSFHGDGAVD